MDFSEALILLKKGEGMKRSGWNGVDLFVYLYDGDEDDLNEWQADEEMELKPCFRIQDSKNKSVNSWVPSISDLLAEDWIELCAEEKPEEETDELKKIVDEISSNNHKILDDWCKVNMARSYQESGEVKPWEFELHMEPVFKQSEAINDLNISMMSGYRYWFTRNKDSANVE